MSTHRPTDRQIVSAVLRGHLRDLLLNDAERPHELPLRIRQVVEHTYGIKLRGVRPQNLSTLFRQELAKLFSQYDSRVNRTTKK
jgi:hypothetical protein